MDEGIASTRAQHGHVAHPHYLADLLVGVACADGVFDMAEAGAITQLIRTAVKANLEIGIVRDIVKESRERLVSEGATSVLSTAGRQLAAAGQLEIALGMAIDVAESSFGVGPEEREALLTCARGGGMGLLDVDRIMRQIQRS